MSDTNAGIYEQEMYIEANPETVFAFLRTPTKWSVGWEYRQLWSQRKAAYT